MKGRLADLAVVGGVTFALRLAWVLVYGRIEPTQIDTLFYEVAASRLASAGDFVSPSIEPTAGWPPGFPFVMSVLYRVFGEHLKLALALNVVLATATAVLLYLIAERMFGRLAGRIAGGFFAILPGPIFFTGLYMSETIGVFIVVAFLALAVFLPERRWTAIALGVALGLAALTHGAGLLLAIVPLAMWWGRYPTRDWVRHAAVLLAAMVLTIAPWTIRNAIVMDAFIPVANNASWTLYVGHNPIANGGPELPDGQVAARVGGEQAGRGGADEEAAPAGGRLGRPQPAEGARVDPAQAGGAQRGFERVDPRVDQPGPAPGARARHV